MKKAIIFDNDGVLVNTEALYFQATKEMCGQLGKELSLEEFINCHIKSSKATWHLTNISDDEIPQWRAWRNTRYSELLQEGDLSFPGVEQVIEEHSRDYRLCIVTSSKKSHFDRIHRENNYLKYFEFIITLEDVSKSKPSPEPYLKALERLNLAAENCLVVEDSFRGLKSAQAANIDCVIIQNNFSQHQDLSEAKYNLDELTKLPKFVSEL